MRSTIHLDKENTLSLKRRIAICLAGAGLVFGLTACAGTPDGEISEIEGAINGEVLEVWSQSAGDHVEIAVAADHDCQLGEIYYECLEPGEVLGRTDVPRYRGEGFEEEPTEDEF
ncbi:hypothetical protein [Actinophytocola glycyrrhizae]|uniref:Uncharacterized protein n=1 Tax=Actinophytocola glycyrrhizae TaxID=2044873 RepID=A0ABV9SC58_9PSEU